MKRELFIEYLENPFLLNEESIKELKVVVERYPFFQTAHLLYAKALSNLNHAEYYSSLKKNFNNFWRQENFIRINKKN